ncbi:SRPBCC family protein [Glycomyces tarimensis]
MEYVSIEREIHVEATPEVVFAVVSRPEHIKQWWQAETAIEPTAGSESELVWGGEGDPDAKGVPITVVAAEPPKRFIFRWTHPRGEAAAEGNSLLVTFELVPSDAGTLLKLTETGFRERDWDLAKLEHEYSEHVNGWDRFVPAIREHAERVASRR